MIDTLGLQQGDTGTVRTIGMKTLFGVKLPGHSFM
jgi:hypothetical protein